MSVLSRAIGVARSLAVYHGIPGRQRRMRRLYRQFVSRGDIVFDIGAHVGNRTRALAALGCRVVSLEPQPDCARLLRAIFARSAGVTVVEVAVGSSPGRADPALSDRTPTVTTLSPSWRAARRADQDFAGVEWNRTIEVPVTTVDALIERFGMPAFVKIDVEGAEPDALAGLSHRVPVLSFEYLPQRAGSRRGMHETTAGTRRLPVHVVARRIVPARDVGLPYRVRAHHLPGYSRCPTAFGRRVRRVERSLIVGSSRRPPVVRDLSSGFRRERERRSPCADSGCQPKVNVGTGIQIGSWLRSVRNGQAPPRVLRSGYHSGAAFLPSCGGPRVPRSPWPVRHRHGRGRGCASDDRPRGPTHPSPADPSRFPVPTLLFLPTLLRDHG